MRWRLGSLVFGAVLMVLALSSPASGHHNCNHTCAQQLDACVIACNSEPGCTDNCWLTFEWCNCYYCNYCL